jgi:hypothetical protein
MSKIVEQETLSAEDKQLFLKLERDAHAFGLQQMSGLTNNREILHALQQEIHSRALQLNSNMLRGEFPTNSH